MFLYLLTAQRDDPRLESWLPGQICAFDEQLATCWEDFLSVCNQYRVVYTPPFQKVVFCSDLALATKFHRVSVRGNRCLGSDNSDS